MSDFVAQAEVDIDASVDDVWTALTDPDKIKEYMMGSIVETDWEVGSPITWSGEWEGKAYQDKGEILAITPQKSLKVTHFSPLTGQDDKPENYHTLEYIIDGSDDSTRLSVTQDNNDSQEEADRLSEQWAMMLGGLKATAEA